MATVALIRTSDGLEKALEEIVERGSQLKAFLNTTTFAQYKNAQLERWKTAGASEGLPWADIGDKYKKQKLRIVQNLVKQRKKESKTPVEARPQNNMTLSGYAAQGRVLMVLTGRLVDAASGLSKGLLKVVSDSGIKITIDDSVLPYGKYVAQKRAVMQFSPDTEAEMVDDLIRFLMTGQGA